MTFAVRAESDTRRIVPAMRQALRALDPAVPAQRLESMDDSMLATIAEPLFQTRLLAAFSLIALLLAAVGTYGVLAYDVSERSREIGLRMALGATPANVLRLVLRRTAGLAVTGAAIGVIGSLAVTGVLAKSLFEVKPNDPLTMVVVVITIIACALMAGYLPARRAMHMDALSVLPRGQ